MEAFLNYDETMIDGSRKKWLVKFDFKGDFRGCTPKSQS